MADQARVKKDWASDEDAGDLLAGILDETQDRAQEEEAKIEADLRARQEEERRRQEEEEARRRREIEARLEAEAHRQEEIEERRTMRMQAIIASNRPAEEVAAEAEAARRAQEEEAEARVQAAAMHQPVPETVHQQRQAVGVSTAAAPRESNKVMLAMVGLLMVLVVALGAVALTLLSGGYEPDATNYTKAQYLPTEPEVHLTQAATTLIPKEEPKVEEVEKEPKAVSRRKRRGLRRSTKSSSSSGSSKKKDSPKKKKGLILSDDPFGGGIF